MDHRESDGICIWCHEPWPCTTAGVRRELSRYLRDLPVGSTGDPAYDNGREAGIQSAADAIDA